MKSKKQLNFDFINPEKKDRVSLKLKPYIKPFEKYLANAEIYGLLRSDNLSDPFSNPADFEINFSTSLPIEFLESRLAYWEQIGTCGYKPTLQVILESEGGVNGSSNNKAFRYHKSRKLRYGPHGIHEYRGKFFPQLVKSLINFSGIRTDQIVIDPMCGSGTTNCEARSMGMRTLGVDLNPLSVKISNIKTSIFDVDQELLEGQVENLIASLKVLEIDKSHVKYTWDKRELDYLERWFSPLALKELTLILDLIRCCPSNHIKELMEISFSNIIRPISWQKDSDLRVRKEIKTYSTGQAISLFTEEIKKNTDKILFYLSCLNNNNINYEFPEFNIIEGDSRYVHKVLPDWEGDCDLLITSPPYATALPYIDTDRLSLTFIGLLPRSKHRTREFLMIGNREVSEKQRQELWDQYLSRYNELPECVRSIIETIALVNHNGEVGFRRRNLPALLGKYFLDMTDAMRNARKMMKPGSYAFYIVGNNSTFINEERIEIETDQFLWEIGEKVGWTKKKIIPMDLLHSRDIFKNNKGTSESILWFQA